MANKKLDYDDLALLMMAAISIIGILGLVLFLKGGTTGNYIKATENTLSITAPPLYKGTPEFYCDDGKFALWTRTAVDAVLKLDYSCTQSDINKDVTCCWPPKE